MKGKLERVLKESLGREMEVSRSAKPEFGHFSTNVPLRTAKETGGDPMAAARELAAEIEKRAPAGFFEKVEAAPPGFVNFRLSAGTIQAELPAVSAPGFGEGDAFRGKKIMVEYTDPNPFKLFHIGHLMTNVIGESIARLHEAAGAEIVRANYQGDVGVHVAKSIWGMRKLGDVPADSATLAEKVAFLGRAYAAGSKAYEEDEAAKAEIGVLNKKIYERSDAEMNDLYDLGKKWSLDYFETLYVRLGTKFDHYFFESEIGPKGVEIVKAHPEIFKESEGAVIFEGEKQGLHNRVFINSQGLPTYEAKELGLNETKFELYRPDISFVVTGNEINEYFKVVLKAMESVLPEVAAATVHLGHGMLRLPTGKMSSRTGDVITAESLIEGVKNAVAEKLKDRAELSEAEREEVKEKVALAAIRYSILKQGIGKDIVFDIGKSIAFQGDSGPYLQYTYARLESILRKAGDRTSIQNSESSIQSSELAAETELALMLHLSGFPEAVSGSARDHAPHEMALYLYELANFANRFYEGEQILTDENAARRAARLELVGAAAVVLRRGMLVLGLQAPEKI